MKHAVAILRMLLIVGLIVSPLYPRVFANGNHPGHGMLLSSEQSLSVVGVLDDAAPCHDGVSDCGKSCAYMSACMSLSIQGLPFGLAVIVGPAGIRNRLAFSSESQLENHIGSLPARPPRA